MRRDVTDGLVLRYSQCKMTKSMELFLRLTLSSQPPLILFTGGLGRSVQQNVCYSGSNCAGGCVPDKPKVISHDNIMTPVPVVCWHTSALELNFWLLYSTRTSSSRTELAGSLWHSAYYWAR